MADGALPRVRPRSLSDELQARLERTQRTWLVTGAAGFIGSNLVECLLGAGQFVIGMDNFATGHRRNLEDVFENVGDEAASRFRFYRGDIRDREDCRIAVTDVDIVLHQAGLGSVPRSIDDPFASQDVNVTGFLTMIEAARQAKVGRFIYASSSSVYGDDAALPKIEDRIGRPLSPYAATKRANEQYAALYAAFGYRATGLRYFNVFGPRQDPNGAYAQVVPKWTIAMLAGGEVVINGDGATSRDFCFIANVVQANVRAALSSDEAQGEVFNVAAGARTSLNELLGMIRSAIDAKGVRADRPPTYAPFRKGDMRHTEADIGKARRLLGYMPTIDVREGIATTVGWYAARNALAPC